jgi:acyl-coenzyme A thioesterase PaaI-like protein
MAEIRALQTTELHAFWDEFAAVMGGPEGLMTYRYLGTHADAIDRHHATGYMKLRRDMRDAHGLHASPLMILIADVVGILDDAIAVPAPTQMAIELLDAGHGVEEVFCEGQIIHEGRSQLFSTATICDRADRDRVIAVARDAGAVVAPAPGGYNYVDPGPGVPDSADLPPLWQAFGATRRGDGAYEIAELTSRIGSTSASLHHGATHIVLEAASMDAATEAAGTDSIRLAHWHVSFTARGKEGPFVTSAKVISVSGDRIAIETELSGAGRLIASVSATYDRV